MDRDNQSHLNSTKVKKEKKKNNLLINACWISHCAGEYLKRKPDIFSSAFSNLFVSWYRRESAKRDSGLFSIKKLGVKKKKKLPEDTAQGARRMWQGGPVGTRRLPGRDKADGILQRLPDPPSRSPALPVAWDWELQEHLGLLKTHSSHPGRNMSMSAWIYV